MITHTVLAATPVYTHITRYALDIPTLSEMLTLPYLADGSSITS
jgi:hypothetical protein